MFTINPDSDTPLVTQIVVAMQELITSQKLRAGTKVPSIRLRARGAQLIGVPLTPSGPDLNALERLAAEHAPRAFFTNPRRHNPTGASYSPSAMHRVLQLAERFDFILIEDDVCADLDVGERRSLACLDQLNRVIYHSKSSTRAGTASKSSRSGRDKRRHGYALMSAFRTGRSCINSCRNKADAHENHCRACMKNRFGLVNVQAF